MKIVIEKDYFLVSIALPEPVNSIASLRIKRNLDAKTISFDEEIIVALLFLRVVSMGQKSGLIFINNVQASSDESQTLEYFSHSPVYSSEKSQIWKQGDDIAQWFVEVTLPFVVSAESIVTPRFIVKT